MVRMGDEAALALADALAAEPQEAEASWRRFRALGGEADEADAARRVWSALDDWRAPPAPARMRRRVLEEARRASPSHARRGTILRLARPALAAAAAVVFVLLAASRMLPEREGGAQPAAYRVLDAKGAEAIARLRPGGTLETAGGPRTVRCPDGTTLRLDAGGALSLVSTVSGGGQAFRLLRGRVTVRVVEPRAGGDAFRLLLPDGGSVVDLGTAFVAEAGEEEVAITLLEGAVRFAYGGETVVMTKANPTRRAWRPGALAERAVAMRRIGTDATRNETANEDTGSATRRAARRAVPRSASTTSSPRVAPPGPGGVSPEAPTSRNAPRPHATRVDTPTPPPAPSPETGDDRPGGRETRPDPADRPGTPPEDEKTTALAREEGNERMDGPRRRTAREVPQAGGEALDPALRHRLETLMADASRSGGGKWVEALRELADISDSPAAQREVFAFFARRLEARREPVIELQELARAIRRETRPPLPKTLLAALAARTAATSERTAAAALEALRAAGPEGREALGAMAEADPEAEVLRQALRRLAAPKR